MWLDNRFSPLIGVLVGSMSENALYLSCNACIGFGVARLQKQKAGFSQMTVSTAKTVIGAVALCAAQLLSCGRIELHANKTKNLRQAVCKGAGVSCTTNHLVINGGRAFGRHVAD